MPCYEIIWNEEPGGNVAHIAQHGLTPDDVEEVLFNLWIVTSAVPPDCPSYSDSRPTDDISWWCTSKSTKSQSIL